jgi:hypothetical protein
VIARGVTEVSMLSVANDGGITAIVERPEGVEVWSATPDGMLGRSLVGTRWWRDADRAYVVNDAVRAVDLGSGAITDVQLPAGIAAADVLSMASDGSALVTGTEGLAIADPSGAQLLLTGTSSSTRHMTADWPARWLFLSDGPPPLTVVVRR